jgi:hypothetical protein
MALELSTRLFRHTLNGWPAYRGAGTRVRAIAPDSCHLRIELRPGLWNRNYCGAHFGGSRSSMADPVCVLMLHHVLGEDYPIWDPAAAIELLKPGRGIVAAEFHLDRHQLERLRREAADGSKLLPEHLVEIKGGSGELVARVRQRRYARLQKRARADARAA